MTLIYCHFRLDDNSNFGIYSITLVIAFYKTVVYSNTVISTVVLFYNIGPRGLYYKTFYGHKKFYGTGPVVFFR